MTTDSVLPHSNSSPIIKPSASATIPYVNLDVPSLLSVEYPLRVKNTDKAIDIIGGSEKLKKCFIEPDMKLELKLRPDDPSSHPIHSTVLKNSENVLLQFKIPKKVLKKNNRDIRKSIEECEKRGIKFHMESCGILRQNYKFRELADFQRLSKKSSFNKKFNESIRVGNFEKIDGFAAELTESLEEMQTFKNGDLDIPSLVRYARMDVSHNYNYYGNLLLDEQGEWLNKSVKLYSIQIHWGDEIPTKHDPKLDDEYNKAINEVEKMKENNIPERLIFESPSYHLIECLNIVKKLFEMKPIWIRRHIHWLLPKNLRSQLRFALPFVTYTFAKGPWRHSFIKLGYDPTKDPKSVSYQIEAFRGNSRMNPDEEIEKTIENDNDAYIIPPTLYEYIDEFSNENSEINKLKIGKIPRQLFFDGKNPCNSLSFQIGDIMDEDVKKVLQGSSIEKICHKGSGWMNWLTLTRVKSIIKYKLTCVKDGLPIDEDKVHDLMTKTVFTKSMTTGLLSEDDDDEDEEEEDDEDENEDEEERDEEDEDEDYNKDNNKTVNYDENGEGTDQNNKEVEDIAQDDIIQRLQKLNPKSANIIHELDNIIKQETLMNENLSKLGKI